MKCGDKKQVCLSFRQLTRLLTCSHSPIRSIGSLLTNLTSPVPLAFALIYITFHNEASNFYIFLHLMIFEYETCRYREWTSSPKTLDSLFVQISSVRVLDNDCRELRNFKLPNGLGSQVFIGNDLHTLD